MELMYENLKNHFRRKLSCFRLELLGFDLLKGVAVVLFTFLLFLFFYAGLLSFFRLLPDFKYAIVVVVSATTTAAAAGRTAEVAVERRHVLGIARITFAEVTIITV